MNINFCIHRYGEWTMLMLGESIMSLLIVDVPKEDGDYFATFYCGLLTVILLQVLHFRSQPHLADQHATRRDKTAGVWWNVFQYIYSMALENSLTGMPLMRPLSFYHKDAFIRKEENIENFLRVLRSLDRVDIFVDNMERQKKNFRNVGKVSERSGRAFPMEMTKLEGDNAMVDFDTKKK